MLNIRVARWTMAAAIAAGALIYTQSGPVLAGALIEPSPRPRRSRRPRCRLRPRSRSRSGAPT